MALTVTEMTAGKVSLGNKWASMGTITFDSSYATNGETIAASNFGFTVLEALYVMPNAGYQPSWDKTNGKIKMFAQGFTTGSTGAADSTSGALVLNDAGAESVFRAMGTATSTTYTTGPLVEVASGVDLSAVVCFYFAVGV